MSASSVIRVSAVALMDSQGHVLTARKRGTNMFMLPGGKPEPGEDAQETAIREIREELRLELSPASLQPLGTFRAPAANEPEHSVEATVFVCTDLAIAAKAVAQAEIAELKWVDPRADHQNAAPLTTQWVFPALLSRQKP